MNAKEAINRLIEMWKTKTLNQKKPFLEADKAEFEAKKKEKDI